MAASYQHSEPGQASPYSQPAQRMDNPGAASSWCEDCCSCFSSGSNYERLGDEHWPDSSQQQCIQHQNQIRKLEKTVDQRKGEVDALKQELGQVKDECTSLQRKIEDQEQHCKQLQNQNHDLKVRLSKLASEKMREGNVCVEDLNDPLRPQAITEQWRGFFTAGEYWVAYELVKSRKSEAEAAQLLFRVCQVVYETCVEFIEELVPTVVMNPPRNTELGTEATPSPPAAVNFPELQRKLDEILPDHTSGVEACIESLKESVPASQRKLRSAVVELLRGAGQPPLLQEKVKQALQDKAIDVGIIEKFVTEMTRLCFHMRLHEIPMAASFHAQSAHSQDPSLYDATGEGQDGAALVIRPPLLREEGGAILCKGELQFFPSQASQQAEGHQQPGETVSQQPAGLLSQQSGGPTVQETQQSGETTVQEAQQSGETVSQDGPMRRGRGQRKEFAE